MVMKLMLVISLMFSRAIVYAGDRDTVTDVYKGILNCSDRFCEGVATMLVLKHLPLSGKGTFLLRELHIQNRPGDKVQEISGTWTLLRGDTANKNAVMVQLDNSATGKTVRHYLKLNDGDLWMLNEKLRPIKDKGDYILHKN